MSRRYRIADFLRDVLIDCIKLVAALCVIATLGALHGCGGSAANEPEDKSTIDPVLCLPSDAGTRGCAT